MLTPITLARPWVRVSRHWRQKIATFIPSTFARSSTPDLEKSAHGPPRVYAHNTGNPFINHYERL
jgi:hypothetical protein